MGVRLPDFLPAGLADPQKGGCQKLVKVARDSMAEGGKNYQFVVYLERPLKRPSQTLPVFIEASAESATQALGRNVSRTFFIFFVFSILIVFHVFVSFILNLKSKKIV